MLRLYSVVYLEVSSSTIESLPLKVLDFGLQRPTEPSSGVVASILLVFPGLDCLEVSLAEVCATSPRLCRLVFDVQCVEITFSRTSKIYGSCTSNNF